MPGGFTRLATADRPGRQAARLAYLIVHEGIQAAGVRLSWRRASDSGKGCHALHENAKPLDRGRTWIAHFWHKISWH